MLMSRKLRAFFLFFYRNARFHKSRQNCAVGARSSPGAEVCRAIEADLGAISSVDQFYLQGDHRAREALVRSPPGTRSAVPPWTETEGGSHRCIPSSPRGPHRDSAAAVRDNTFSMRDIYYQYRVHSFFVWPLTDRGRGYMNTDGQYAPLDWVGRG